MELSKGARHKANMNKAYYNKRIHSLSPELTQTRDLAVHVHDPARALAPESHVMVILCSDCLKLLYTLMGGKEVCEC